MKLDIDKIRSNDELIRLEAELVELTSATSGLRFADEKEICVADEKYLNIAEFSSRTSNQEMDRINRLLLSRSSSKECLEAVWNRAFSQNTFCDDLETLASALLGKTVTIRNVEVAAQDPKTRIITARYPEPRIMRKLLSNLAHYVEKPAIADMPFLSSVFVLLYFYRLHPLCDGNGRTSRAIINICLRNYSILSAPILQISPIFFRYMYIFQPSVRNEDDKIFYFQSVMRIYLKSLKTSQEIGSSKHIA